jgi:outer membrane protein insertion porin family
VRINIQEGPLVRVGRIHVRGLVRTNENVVRRNLTFYPGEVASSEEFDRSKSLLINSGVFERDRNAVQIELAPGDDAVRDVIVRVQEGPTANLIFSGGFGSRDGFFGEVSLSEENFDITNWPTSWRDLLHGNAFRGAGHKLRMRLYASQEATYYNLSFLNPAVYDSRYSFGWDLYSTARSRREYDEERAGFALNGGRSLTKFITHTLSIGYENVDVEDVDPTAPAAYQRDEGSHSRPFARYIAKTDRRDNRFLPSEGYFLQALLEYAAGDVDVAMFQLQGEKYITLLENEQGGRHVLALRGELGVVDSVGGDRVPVFERFFAGGFRSIRGFEYEGVSPVAPGTDDAVGGESMLTGSVEYMFPLEAERFHVLLFADGGYVQEDAADVFNGWDELRLSVGIGARFSLGQALPGNIEISFAAPVMEEDFDETQPFQFSFGAGTRF